MEDEADLRTMVVCITGTFVSVDVFLCYLLAARSFLYLHNRTVNKVTPFGPFTSIHLKMASTFYYFDNGRNFELLDTQKYGHQMKLSHIYYISKRLKTLVAQLTIIVFYLNNYYVIIFASQVPTATATIVY